MKLARLLFPLVLIAAMLAAPEAFGAKPKGATLHGARPQNGAKVAEACFDIDCGDGTGTSCCGSVDYCLGYCDGFCGTDPGTCQYVDD
jgi:hypothetical protein